MPKARVWWEQRCGKGKKDRDHGQPVRHVSPPKNKREQRNTPCGMCKKGCHLWDVRNDS